MKIKSSLFHYYWDPEDDPADSDANDNDPETLQGAGGEGDFDDNEDR